MTDVPRSTTLGLVLNSDDLEGLAGSAAFTAASFTGALTGRTHGGIYGYLIFGGSSGDRSRGNHDNGKSDEENR